MRNRPLLLGALAVLLAIGGAAVAYVVFLRGDNVAPLALSSPSPTASAAATASKATGSAAPSLAAASAAITAAEIPGNWTIAANSIVGYRVREKLASLPAESDAVGRTNAITGTATVEAAGSGIRLSTAEFSVDMTTVASDRQMRDNRLRNSGIETDTFKTSTFNLTSPIDLPATATTGAQVDVTLHGDLTLHGVTKTVDIPAKAQLSGSTIQVQGSLPFPFSDFNIVAPNIGGFVSVEDKGTLEFLVNLTKA